MTPPAFYLWLCVWRARVYVLMVKRSQGSVFAPLYDPGDVEVK